MLKGERFGHYSMPPFLQSGIATPPFFTVDGKLVTVDPVRCNLLLIFFLKKTLITGHLPVTFLIAPLAVAGCNALLALGLF
jgi:hypothetical protein